MKVTLIIFAAAAAIMAQSVDTVSATQSGVCEPHNDHWHCPAGVVEPTTAPALVTPTGSAASAITKTSSHSHDDEDDHDHDHAVSASTCEPHGDHWHCPSGVAQPLTRPAAASATTTRNSVSAAGASASPSSSQTPGTAAKVGSGALAAVGAVGAWFL